MPIVARAASGRPARFAATLVAAVLALAACGPASPPTAPADASSPSRASTPPSTAPSGAAGGACTPAVDVASHDWNERVWYEVFVRSFRDSNGDGIGDLEGLTAKLDYLNDGDPTTHTDLGIGGIWLMPVFQSPSYHGYDVADYRTIERDYGTNADFKAFLAAAHQRGIKVILDLVLNHTSRQSPWFKDAVAGGPHHDWYVWSPTDPHWPSPVGGGNPWHQASNGEWYYGAFWEGMPDLNFRNADATAAVTDIARFWLDLGVDGFRLDAARHLIEDGPKQQVDTPETLAWLKAFNAAVEAAEPGALTVGEVWDSNQIAGRYVPDSTDLTFDFDLAAAILTAVKAEDSGSIVTALNTTVASWPPNQAASFLSNHDQERVMNAVGRDPASAKLAAFALFASPGVPFVYYGEELGLAGTKPDERIRTPMPWSAEGPSAGFSAAEAWEPLEDGWQTANVSAETADPQSLLSTYRDLIALRGEQAALRDGTTAVVDAGNAHPVAAWLRSTANQTLLAVVNVGDEPVGDYALTLEGGPFCGPLSAHLVKAIGDPAKVAPVPPTPSAAGGFAGYRPLPTLAPRAGYLIELDPAP